MVRKSDEKRQGELVRSCLEKNNLNDGRDIRSKLNDMRVKCKGQDKVLLNMMISDMD